MGDSDAEWIDVDNEWGKPGASTTKPSVWTTRPTMPPPRPHTAPPHDAADRLGPTNPGSSSNSTMIVALSLGGVLGVVLVLMLVYLFVLRKRYKSVKTQQNAAEYQVRIEDAAHVISNMDESCNTYVNTTDLQKLVNTVRAKGKSQERLPLPPRLHKPALSLSPSSDNINNGFTLDGDVAVRPPKPAPSHYKPPLVPPYETVVLNPDFKSNVNSDTNGVYTNVDGKENDSKEPKFLIPFKTLSLQEAQLVATTESSKSSQNSSVVTTTVSPISRPKVEPPKVPSTSSGTSAAVSRPAPPPPPNAVKKSESSHSIKKSASSDSLKVAPLTAPKPSLPKNSKPTQPTPPSNPKPFTLAPSNPKPSAIIPQPNQKPTVPSNPKPSPILPPTHTKPTPIIPTKNITSSDSSPQNKLLSSVKKGKLPLLPPLKTGLSPSLSRDASIDTPETAIEYLTPDCSESSPATASISAKIAFLEGKMKTVNQ